jgi:hypothetical protein
MIVDSSQSRIGFEEMDILNLLPAERNCKEARLRNWLKSPPTQESLNG